MIVCTLLNKLTYLNKYSPDKHSFQPVVFAQLPWLHFCVCCSFDMPYQASMQSQSTFPAWPNVAFVGPLPVTFLGLAYANEGALG